MKEAAHSLKGSSGYAGASRLHYDCYFIQEAFIKKEHEIMRYRYNSIIENTIQFMTYTNEMIDKDSLDSEFASKIQCKQFELSDIVLANDYQVIAIDDYELPYLCLSKD